MHKTKTTKQKSVTFNTTKIIFIDKNKSIVEEQKDNNGFVKSFIEEAEKCVIF